MCKLLLDSVATAINYNSLNLWTIAKVFFIIQGTSDSDLTTRTAD